LSQAIERANPDGAPKRKTIMQLIEEQTPQLQRALPAAANMTPDRLARLALTTIRTNPKLAACTQESLLGALMTCAQLGLELGPLGHAYLVPFTRNAKVDGEWRKWNEAQFVIGYKGILELARRSGNIKSIEARTVFEHDDFEYSYGLSPVLRHTPTLRDRGQAVASYGVAHFHDGGFYFLVMPMEDITRIRDRSKSYNPDKPSGPWHDDFDAMARKTVIRAMAPYLPLSTEMAQAFNRDETVRTDYSVDTLDEERDYDDAIDVPELQEVTGGDAADREAAAGVSDAVTASPPAPSGDDAGDTWEALPDDVASADYLATCSAPQLQALADLFGVKAPTGKSKTALGPLADAMDTARGTS
jgi:recombination protein RecT